MSQDTLRTIYFSYFHFILPYSIIFWGNSAYSPNIFKIQKRIIRIIMNSRNRNSCCQLFKKLKILSLKSQYIFSPFYYSQPEIEIHMNQIQSFIISTSHLVLTYIPNCKLEQLSKKDPFILESKFLITFLLASKMHPMHKPIQICSKKFPSYKFILLFGVIFYLEFEK